MLFDLHRLGFILDLSVFRPQVYIAPRKLEGRSVRRKREDETGPSRAGEGAVGLTVLWADATPSMFGNSKW